MGSPKSAQLAAGCRQRPSRSHLGHHQRPHPAGVAGEGVADGAGGRWPSSLPLGRYRRTPTKTIRGRHQGLHLRVRLVRTWQNGADGRVPGLHFP
jgi:hypothetical protein